MEQKKGKKADNNEVLNQLLMAVTMLTKEVADLKAKQAAAPTAPKKEKAKKGEPRPDVWYHIKGFPSEKRPPQCLRVFRVIAQAAPAGGKMTEVDIWNALMGPDNKLGPWNYSQDPFYIFKYYRAPMIEGEYIQGPFNS